MKKLKFLLIVILIFSCKPSDNSKQDNKKSIEEPLSKITNIPLSKIETQLNRDKYIVSYYNKNTDKKISYKAKFHNNEIVWGNLGVNGELINLIIEFIIKSLKITV